MGPHFKGELLKLVPPASPASNSNILSSFGFEYTTVSEQVSGTTQSEVPPTYDVYREAHQPIGLSPDAKRLKWALEGPLHSAVEVMHSMKYVPEIPTEPYGEQTGLTTTWHSISQSPLTDPKVSSVIVHIEIVEDWEYQWLEHHRFCHDPEENGEDPDEFLFGNLPDYDPDSDEEDEVHLLRCCRADRPRKKGETLLVKATGAFLTIHDYLSVVHPWLSGRREDIFGAEGDLMKNEPLATNTKLMISNGLPDQVNFETEEDWREHKSKEPLRYDYPDIRSHLTGSGDMPFLKGYYRVHEYIRAGIGRSSGD